ncbi:pre-mRNA-splicing factor prp46-like isoform x1 [Plakobranchus ocellatus]|uniref:Pre-mRNA-splicing factor prp46-like isoform x1 n=1 Tax=Plakobranchus ocellatus TaxID=259542 RepID=A0AAV3WVJ4_9GAST|nr:pre-mRNA-splicing factor prp46-like isoform x1 [Plakobranchus ocellatus]
MLEASPSNLVRKLRKKLRQIENLERLNRPLTEEEVVKVNSKFSTREHLKDVLDQLENEPKIGSINIADSSAEQSNEEGHLVSENETEISQDAICSDESHLPEVSSKDFGSGDHNHPHESNVLFKSADSSLQKQDTKSQVKGDSSKAKKEDKGKKAGGHLSKRRCRVTTLEGHSDIVTSLVIVDGRVVTASRDTALKSWDLTTGGELHTFGGHTETVTCVTAVDSTHGKLIDPGFFFDDHLIISASFDCTFKMWSLSAGKLLKSVYTFNPLTKICFFPSTNQLVTGSDGGKLELWDIATGENCFSTLAYDAPVSGIVVSDQMIYCGSANGILKVYQRREDGHLACLFVSDEVKAGEIYSLTPRHIRCMAKIEEGLLFGDDSRNLKLLDWRKGQIKKFPNHTTDFSSTDAVSCHDGLILSSSYDLDEGLGYVNVRQGKELTYQASLDDGETERIMTLDFCLGPGGSIVAVTGGVDLKLWHIFPASGSQTGSSDDEVISLEFRQALSVSATDSATESEDDDGADDYEESDEEEENAPQDANSSVHQGGLLSWCTIV